MHEEHIIRIIKLLSCQEGNVSLQNPASRKTQQAFSDRSIQLKAEDNLGLQGTIRGSKEEGHLTKFCPIPKERRRACQVQRQDE